MLTIPQRGSQTEQRENVTVVNAGNIDAMGFARGKDQLCRNVMHNRIAGTTCGYKLRYCAVVNVSNFRPARESGDYYKRGNFVNNERQCKDVYETPIFESVIAMMRNLVGAEAEKPKSFVEGCEMEKLRIYKRISFKNENFDTIVRAP